MPASIIETIMVDQVHAIPWWKRRVRGIRSDTCRSSCDKFSTELTATAARERPMKNSAQPKVSHLAEDDVRAAVHDIADHDGALVVG